MENLTQKFKKVFISHATKDIAYVKPITELLEDIGLTEEQLVCSSVPEYGIPLGEDIYDWLSKQFQSCDLHVLFILSDNYYSSAACLNEMGAAWVLKTRYDSVLLPGFEFRDIKGAVNPNQISIKLDGDERVLKQHLNELKDNLVSEFRLHMPSASKWERHRDDFIVKIRREIENAPAEVEEGPEGEKKLHLTEDAAELLVNASKDPSGQIVVIKVYGGSGISTNGRSFVVPASGPREEARWSGAIDELENYGLIQAASYKRQVFSVTREGYEAADKIVALGKFTEVSATTDNVTDLL